MNNYVQEEILTIYKNPTNFVNIFFTGRSLMRLSENSLLRIGVVHPEHRQEILRKISQQRIKSNMLLLRDMERRQQTEEQENM